MGLAEDKVYNHITRNLKKFSTIRVASLANSLTCLVDADRVISYFAELYHNSFPNGNIELSYL